MFSAWSKCVATLTASWPVAASSTSRISCGLTRSRSRTSSCTSGSSICSRPAVSKMSVLRLFGAGEVERLAGDLQHIRFALADEDRDLELLARASPAGPWPPGDRRPPPPATACGPACAAAAPACRWRWSCPSRAGPPSARSSDCRSTAGRRSPSPSSSTSSSWMILMICWPG